MKDFNFYICIYHQSGNVEYDYTNDQMILIRHDRWIPDDIYKDRPSNEVVIVLTRHNFKFAKSKTIADYLKTLLISKVAFFIEDVLQIYDVRTSSLICGQTIPLEFIRAYDIDIIESIVKMLNVEYDIFHCESNTRYLEKNYDLKIKYFDIFVISSVMFLTALGKFDHKFEYKMSCFNSRLDFHRYMIASLLYDQKDILLTLLFTESADIIINNDYIKISDFSQNVKERIVNGCIALEDKNIDLSWDIKRNSIKGASSINTYHQSKTITAVQKSAVDLVTETKFYSIMPNFSEKVLKPMNVCRPFLLLAPPGTLKLLKDLGFKTFDRWWDESYDLIENHSHRLESVYHISKSLLSKSNEELVEMLIEMSDILIYNSKHIKNLYDPMMNLNKGHTCT